MSNRDRIDRAAAEAEAKRKSKEDKKKAKAVAAPAEKAEKAAPKRPTGRMKVVWALIDPNWRISKTFPYPEKAKAEAEAKRLTKEKGADWTVRPEKVPMEE